MGRTRLGAGAGVEQRQQARGGAGAMERRRHGTTSAGRRVAEWEQGRQSVQRRARPWRGGQSPVGDDGALAVEGAPAGNAVAAGERLGEGRRWPGGSARGPWLAGVRGCGRECARGKERAGHGVAAQRDGLVRAGHGLRWLEASAARASAWGLAGVAGSEAMRAAEARQVRPGSGVARGRGGRGPHQGS
nr:uncharacterized protein LOC109756400 [Aegilops tauschii subsp. strangulata]